VKHEVQNGNLIITASAEEVINLRQIREDDPDFGTHQAEVECLEHLLANSELDWVDPSECGDLTAAPILGIRDENGDVVARWGFMNYALRSFMTDLADEGRAVFQGPQ